MPLAPGTRLGPYEILSTLGAGGFGEVYRARDARVERVVALKVLPERFLEGEEHKGRFVREARALASLNHPGIATLYSFEEIPGPSPSASRHVLVMELVDGQGLDKRLASGPLSLEESLSFARQIAEALAYAHGKGILHRDLKPANVMVTPEGRIKLLDFGLAKQVGLGAGESEASTLDRLTEEGSVFGTLSYMSPEQLLSKPLDARSDLFSLGVVMYEMATGRLPFQAKSKIAIANAILNSEPGEFEDRPGPKELKPIIARLLKKDPQKRYASAADLQRELTSLETPAGARKLLPSRGAWVGIAAAAIVLVTLGVWYWRKASRDGQVRAQIPETAPLAPAIAVLPFANLSSDREQEYFSDGLTEELIGRLTKVAGLRVTARTSSFAFKGKTEDLRAIGKALNVGTVLEGSVRRSGDTLRVSTRLVSAQDGYQIWADTYERKMAEAFAVQDEIAAAVVGALRVRLLPQDRARQAHRVPHPDAYGQYLLGQRLQDKKRALEAFSKAAELDPGYALPHVALGFVALSRADGAESLAAHESGMNEALAQMSRAIALEPDLADGYDGRAAVRYQMWDFAGSQMDRERALALDPGRASILAGYGYLLASLGRLPEGIVLCQRAAELDPLNAGAQSALAELLYDAGRFTEARAVTTRALEVAPSKRQLIIRRGFVALLERDPAAALRDFESGGGDWPEQRLGRVMALHDLGRTKESQQALDTMIADSSNFGAYQIAAAYAWRGEREKAFEWLGRAFRQRDTGLATLKADFYFSKVRDDPRYTEMLKKLKLPVDGSTSDR